MLIIRVPALRTSYPTTVSQHSAEPAQCRFPERFFWDAERLPKTDDSVYTRDHSLAA